MSNDELLIQISEMLDKKLKPLNEKIDQLDKKVDQVKDENHFETQNIRLLLENDIIPPLQNIESCYTDTYRRYIVGVEQIEALQADMEILKRVVNEHSKKLQNI